MSAYTAWGLLLIAAALSMVAAGITWVYVTHLLTEAES